MTLVQIAKDRCANWDTPSGRCFGISAEFLRGEPGGRVQPLDHCRLSDGERCVYFERCVIPGIPRQGRAKMPDFALENKGVAGGILAAPSPSIKKLGRSQMYQKRKDLRTAVKTRLNARRAS